MEQFTEGESTRGEIKNKLRQNFDGKIIRKDLTVLRSRGFRWSLSCGEKMETVQEKSNRSYD